MPLVPHVLLARFAIDRNAATNVLFALSLIPIAGMAGAAIDMSRAVAVKTQLQNALDAAVLAGSQHTATGRDVFATSMFTAQKPSLEGSVGSPAFALNTDGTYSGSASATVTNKIMSIVGIASTPVHVTSKAAAVVYDESCILTYGTGMNVGDDAMTFNGGSNLDLTGCTLQSNKSMVCNGHTGNADMSLAVGTSSKCLNPVSSAPAIPDIYESIASNLTKECGTTSFNNLSWTSSSKPASNKMVTLVKDDRTEYHVCGNLTLSGSGTMTGTSISKDTVIVVENGALTIAKDADITATRATFVLSGNVTSASHTIDFPQGNGQAAALRITPSKASTDPWRGIAMYQDPALTTNVDMTWGPGSSVYVDGIMYFPKASLTMSGAGNSNSSLCTKLAVNKLTTNGSFNFSQTDSGCTDINMRQYESPPRLIN